MTTIRPEPEQQSSRYTGVRPHLRPAQREHGRRPDRQCHAGDRIADQPPCSGISIRWFCSSHHRNASAAFLVSSGFEALSNRKSTSRVTGSPVLASYGRMNAVAWSSESMTRSGRPLTRKGGSIVESDGSNMPNLAARRSLHKRGGRNSCEEGPRAQADQGFPDG